MTHNRRSEAGRGWLVSVTALALLTGCALGQEGGAAEHPALVVDHTCVDAADRTIPAAALDRARAARVLLAHQSVGFDVIRGLEALSTQQPQRYGLEIGHMIQPQWYQWKKRGLGEFFCGRNGSAESKLTAFAERLRGGLAEQVQIASVKLCYADLLEQHDPEQIFGAYARTLAALEQEYQAIRFVWWTIPVMRTERLQAKRTRFNELMRAYVAEHHKTLFDLADIESHDPDGNPVTGPGGPMLFAGYARDQGHLNDQGAQRVARAWWWLQARLTGWPGPQ